MPKKETSNESRFDAFFGAAKLKQLEDEAGTAKSDMSDERVGTVRSYASDEVEQPVAKHKDPNVQRTTLYIPKALHRKFKAAAVEEGREMSEIMETLIQQWLDSRSSDV